MCVKRYIVCVWGGGGAIDCAAAGDALQLLQLLPTPAADEAGPDWLLKLLLLADPCSRWMLLLRKAWAVLLLLQLLLLLLLLLVAAAGCCCWLLLLLHGCLLCPVNGLLRD